MKYIILSLILLIILLIVNIRRTKNMFVNIFLIINILLLILSILNNIIGINYEVYSKIKGILELGYALVFTYYTYTITVEKYFTKKEVISALSVVFLLCSILMIIYPFSKQVSDFYTSNGLGYTVCYISILVQIFFSFILSLIYITKNKLKIGKNGKPYLEGNPFYISLSHSGDFVAVVLSKFPVGIDIQKTRRVNSSIFKLIFNENDNDFYINSRNKSKAFYKIWTFKESYLKMTGEGLTKPLKSVFIDYNYDFNGSFFTNYCIENIYWLEQAMQQLFPGVKDLTTVSPKLKELKENP